MTIFLHLGGSGDSSSEAKVACKCVNQNNLRSAGFTGGHSCFVLEALGGQAHEHEAAAINKKSDSG